MSSIRIGVDTGGTFTDLIGDPGAPWPLVTYKLLSTPSDPSRAVIVGIGAILELLAKTGREIDGGPLVVHGSTVATNAVLEGKGAPAAFVTTEGFEDTLAIARQNRPDLYALEVEQPVPPIGRSSCFGIEERIGPSGEIWRPLPSGAGERLAASIQALGVQSVAISLLHSYANPAHEAAIANDLRRLIPDIHVTVSHELMPEHREYERATTCVLNAIVAPPMIRYLNKVADCVGSDRLRIMASGGGSLPVDEVERLAVSTILSGPAGGILGAWAVAQDAGVGRIITLDMGGTSTDVALCDGGPGRTTETRIAGLPLRLPMIDIHTVGAGGGSAATVDEGGALRVGPESMGADPGPACYGIQQRPYTATVTDAHVVLGHIPADQRLSGRLQLDPEAALEAVGRVAQATGLSVVAAATGILRVAEVTMARAVQRISVERGFDPRDFVMLPFGGAGGLHACSLAEALGITRILLPEHAGLLSALGMLASSPLYSFSESILLQIGSRSERVDVGDIPEIRAARKSLRNRAMRALERENVSDEDRLLTFEADMRYVGQSFELSIPLAHGDTLALFEERHRTLYGYDAPSKAIEIVALRVQATATAPKLRLEPYETREVGGGAPPFEHHQVIGSSDSSRWRRINRRDLRAGDIFDGPAVVTEYAATTIIAAGWSVRVLPAGHLSLQYQVSTTV